MSTLTPPPDAKLAALMLDALRLLAKTADAVDVTTADFHAVDDLVGALQYARKVIAKAEGRV